MSDEADFAPPVPFAPTLEPHERQALLSGASRLRDAHDLVARESLMAELLEATSGPLRASLLTLIDLARQGWRVDVSGEEGEEARLEVRMPRRVSADHREEKARLRAQELVKRDEQLKEPSTRAFIESMEYPPRARRSVFTLMRDGVELAAALRAARQLSGEERLRALQGAVDPYLQVVTDERCARTGLKLQDIWRYFRHTWSNQYMTTPGRTLGLLVRDAARPSHPVIGIAAIGSSIMQIRERDMWIGWHAEAFLERERATPDPATGRWLLRTVEEAIGELFTEDLIAEGLVSSEELAAPTAEGLARLEAYAGEQRALHHAAGDPREASRAALACEPHERWRRMALTPLYKSKRAASLADLLRSRRALRAHLSATPTAEELAALLSDDEGEQAVRRVLRKARGDRLGVAMADVTVCGAVPPYGPLLGGKLVAALAASPALVAAYGERYQGQESEIASAMAGRAVVRSSRLALLGTTSLYGVGSSQYNRIKVPTAPLGGDGTHPLAYVEVGRSEAYGTAHLSEETVEALAALGAEARGAQRVNGIFGEGGSPKLRKVREGLSALGLPSDELLRHGRHRIVYLAPLIKNLRPFLLGLEGSPEYIYDLSDPARGTAAVAAWWRARWLSGRVEREEALAEVARHAAARPREHGARVPLPRLETAEGPQLSLFDLDDER